MIKNSMKQFVNVLGKLLEHVATGILIIVFICVLIQVFFRYVLNSPLTWTEEAIRNLNIWSVLLGVALAVKLKDHLRVDLIDKYLEKMSVRFQASFNIIINLLCLFLVIIFLKGSFTLTVDRWSVMLSVIPMSQGAVYLALFLSSCIMILFLLIQLKSQFEKILRDRNKGGV